VVDVDLVVVVAELVPLTTWLCRRGRLTHIIINVLLEVTAVKIRLFTVNSRYRLDSTQPSTNDHQDGLTGADYLYLLPHSLNDLK